MVRSSLFLYMGAAALVASAATLATGTRDTLAESTQAPVSSVEAMAAAYWSDRSGQLPPNRPVTKRPVPEKTRGTPPGQTVYRQKSRAVSTLPAGRTH
jgi:hypothetical protein